IDDTVVMPNGDLVVGGNFTSIAGVPAIGLARWDGATWSAFGDPIFPWQVGTVGDLILQPNGELVVAGSFKSIGGVSANGVAAWNGSTWSPLGQIGSGFVGVGQLVRLPTGELIASGLLNGVFGIQRWDGATWSTLTGLSGATSVLYVDTIGTLIAGGLQLEAGGVATQLAGWNGATWSAIPGAHFDGRPFAMTELFNGDLLVGGALRNLVAPAQPLALGGLARFDGS